MNKNQIGVRPKSIRDLLDGVKYGVDDYQRSYNWQTKQIAELLEDLSNKFLESYKEDDERMEVENYLHYFLGSIIISKGSGKSLIVDGQQRLISLTLLLIFLNNLQNEQNRSDRVNLDSLIFSEKYGHLSFNMEIPGATEYIEYIFRKTSKTHHNNAEITDRIADRYSDIETLFLEELRYKALPYFIDWIKENVDLVEITTNSDTEAYTIFETMNDRGLNLTSIERLKSYLLSKITNLTERSEANKLWQEYIFELRGVERSETPFFTAWLGGKHLDIDSGDMERDMVKVRNMPHKLVRERSARLGLRKSSNYRDFILKDFKFFAKNYIFMSKAGSNFSPDLDYLFFANQSTHSNPLLRRRFEAEILNMLILSSLNTSDEPEVISRKIKLVSVFLEMVHVYQGVVNFGGRFSRRFQGLPMTLIEQTRGKDIPTLANILKNYLVSLPLTFENMTNLSLNAMNSSFIHYLLSRITAHIEQKCGIESNFITYFDKAIEKPFEIEHLWPDQYHLFRAHFSNEKEFDLHRNKIGGLILLPNGINQSLGATPFREKVEIYYGQNLLAKTLSERCYKRNPAFLRYKNTSGILFKGYTDFTKNDFDDRTEIYKKICEEIWDINFFDREILL